jgi:hypothetical protein
MNDQHYAGVLLQVIGHVGPAGEEAVYLQPGAAVAGGHGPRPVRAGRADDAYVVLRKIGCHAVA